MTDQTLSNFDKMLLDWKAKKEVLEIAKAEEAEIRAQIVAKVFSEEKLEGTETYELGQGWKLKASKRLNYSLNNKDDATEKALEKLPDFVADRLVSWKPSLSIREYKQLDNNQRKIIDRVLTIKPGMPSLELVEPKGKK